MIFMGAGEKTKAECKKLHEKLDEGLSWLSGLQQLGSGGDQHMAEETDRGNEAIVAVIQNIASAFGATVHRADDEMRYILEIQMKRGTGGMRLFAFDDDPESDAYQQFLVVEQDFWEKHGYLDDQHIGDMPPGFIENQESIFEYEGTAEEGRELLLKMGYKEEKKLLP